MSFLASLMSIYQAHASFNSFYYSFLAIQILVYNAFWLCLPPPILSCLSSTTVLFPPPYESFPRVHIFHLGLLVTRSVCVTMSLEGSIGVGQAFTTVNCPSSTLRGNENIDHLFLLLMMLDHWKQKCFGWYDVLFSTGFYFENSLQVSIKEVSVI